MPKHTTLPMTSPRLIANTLKRYGVIQHVPGSPTLEFVEQYADGKTRVSKGRSCSLTKTADGYVATCEISNRIRP